MTKKKYILKPGKHQFAPKSHPSHHNDNLTDEEAEWYLEKYPHIRSLFIIQSESAESQNKESVESPIESVQSQIHEDLSTTN